MRAMVLSTTGPIESSPPPECDLPLPEPAAGQVRLRVEADGIRGTGVLVPESAGRTGGDTLGLVGARSSPDSHT